LAKTFGWTKSEIEEQPAVWLDWLIAIDKEVADFEARNRM
jgi:hypothetical protein